MEIPFKIHMLRDHLVCGTKDACIQWCLLAETFQKAVELALGQEPVEKGAAHWEKSAVNCNSCSQAFEGH